MQALLQHRQYYNTLPYIRQNNLSNTFLSVLAILFHESLKTNIKKEKKANIKKEKKILRETKFAITNLKNKARVPPVHFSIQCQEQ